MHQWVKNREKMLQNDKNNGFLSKWEKQSKKFGKKTIFNLFQSTYDSLKSDTDTYQFKNKFDKIIIKTLKEKKDIQFFKKTNYKEIMSLFGKFTYIIKNYWDEVFDVIEWSRDNNIENNSKKNITQNEWIQIALFDELSQDNNKIIKTSHKIDIDVLYSKDPDEKWFHR